MCDWKDWCCHERNAKIREVQQEPKPPVTPDERSVMRLRFAKMMDSVLEEMQRQDLDMELGDNLSPEDIFAYLVLHVGVDVDTRCCDNTTALMIAAADGDASFVRTLLNLGANPNLTDNFGRNARKHAEENKHQDIINLLDRHKQVRESE
ncbi:MAG: ankyrin repeat domain-containing protein [Candidatus Woesearchaeota archaeon]